MPDESETQAQEPKFGPEVDKPEPTIGTAPLAPHLESGSVSVSLRYYQRRCECFSAWKSQELKYFSSTIDKIRGYSAKMLIAKKNLCEMHKGKPSRERFSRPSEISEDQSFYEIKVDQANKLRVHGFFVGDVFFLIWLDHGHECFRS